MVVIPVSQHNAENFSQFVLIIETYILGGHSYDNISNDIGVLVSALDLARKANLTILVCQIKLFPISLSRHKNIHVAKGAS